MKGMTHFILFNAVDPIIKETRCNRNKIGSELAEFNVMETKMKSLVHY